MFTLSARHKGLELLVNCDHNLPTLLLGDSHRLGQVLTNLMSNALKFTEKGTIELRVAAASGGRWVNDKNQVGSTSAPAPVAVSFAVKDSGIGIPAQRLDAIFEKFTQVDSSTTRLFGGTGLGLSICKQLVESMGGQIEVTSQEGEGSTFRFVIALAETSSLTTATSPAVSPAVRSAPVTSADETATVAQSSDASTGTSAVDDAGPGADADGSRILVVEDNVVNQRLASLLLGKQGYEAVVAADGLEALECLRQEEFVLILMDVQMPRMDGLTATREIRAIEKEAEQRRKFVALARCTSPIPIVGLTAHAHKEDEETCFAAGMDAFLVKPMVRSKLIATLAALTGKRGKEVASHAPVRAQFRKRLTKSDK